MSDALPLSKALFERGFPGSNLKNSGSDVSRGHLTVDLGAGGITATLSPIALFCLTSSTLATPVQVYFRLSCCPRIPFIIARWKSSEGCALRSCTFMCCPCRRGTQSRMEMELFAVCRFGRTFELRLERCDLFFEGKCTGHSM